ETLRTQARLPEVTPRQPCSTNVELATCSGRNRLELGVQHIRPSVPDWPANWNRAQMLPSVSPAARVNCAPNGGFGRPILIKDRRLLTKLFKNRISQIGSE